MASETPAEKNVRPTPTELIALMDDLLAKGRDAMAKVDAHYAETGIEPGIGEKILLSDAISPEHRVIIARLLAEYRNMEQRIAELDPNNKAPAPKAVAVRAVGNRYRI